MPFHFLTPRTSLKISPKLMWIQSGISWDTEIPINLSEERGEIILPCPHLIPEVFSCFFSSTVFTRSESKVFSQQPNPTVRWIWSGGKKLNYANLESFFQPDRCYIAYGIFNHIYQPITSGLLLLFKMPVHIFNSKKGALCCHLDCILLNPFLTTVADDGWEDV